ncbi:PspA/IM30 family protein [Paenibacillus piri]|uniref:PspA/IM30 family protein n=1 Tax=Paenibacillus piri TaxID=2547395 RepID=A0A4R5KFF8_9BACL|nr:PspA/IM30 family protein [Paenibacillus piri]TDF94111.1 PspA/IM30 family protein [Paenibacillus piri]
MGAWKRIVDISKAAVNEALNKMEQPEMMLNHYLRSMEEETHHIRQALIQEAAAHRMLEQQIAGCNRQAEQFDRKAGEAMADERMAEARQALESKLDFLDKAAEYTRASEASAARTAELERRLNQAQADYADMQAKRSELMERAGKVKSHAQAYAAAAGTGYFAETGSAARGFQRIEETITRKEAEIEAANSVQAAAAAARESLIEEQLSRLRSRTPQQ